MAATITMSLEKSTMGSGRLDPSDVQKMLQLVSSRNRDTLAVALPVNVLTDAKAANATGPSVNCGEVGELQLATAVRAMADSTPQNLIIKIAD